MTWGGWISMTLSVTFVTALFVWCSYRVVRADRGEDDGATLEDE